MLLYHLFIAWVETRTMKESLLHSCLSLPLHMMSSQSSKPTMNSLVQTITTNPKSVLLSNKNWTNDPPIALSIKHTRINWLCVRSSIRVSQEKWGGGFTQSYLQWIGNWLIRLDRTLVNWCLQWLINIKVWSTFRVAFSLSSLLLEEIIDVVGAEIIY